MTDPLPILPFQCPVQGTVDLPGSKSLSNRALILAALAEGETELRGMLFSRDTEIMIAALRQLGLQIKANPEAQTVSIEGCGGQWPERTASLHIGNAGTAARFLTALLALHPGGTYALDGDAAMRQRPMAELLEVLIAQGTTIEFAGEPGYFPFTLHTHGLVGGSTRIDARASSQFVSALLMVAPYAKKPMELSISGLRPAFVRITTQMMKAFGISITGTLSDRLNIPAGTPLRAPGVFAIEPDVTAASYFLALPLVTGGEIHLPGLTPAILQGDAEFAEVIEALGARLEKKANEWIVSANPVDHGGLDRDFHHFSDTFLTLAALAPLMKSTTVIRGIEHTRRQETDRVTAMATELRKLGCTVEEGEDSLHITPDRSALRRAADAGVEIETYEDHRFAMSFGILGCANLRGDGQPWLRIIDPACCGKTFPDFFRHLSALHAASHL